MAKLHIDLVRLLCHVVIPFTALADVRTGNPYQFSNHETYDASCP